MGKECIVTGVIVYDLLECFYRSLVEVVEYNCVSEQEWVYAPWRWIYVVELLVLPFNWLRDCVGSAYSDY